MDFLETIFKDKEICEMKAFLKEKTGRVPGFGFWDGETIEEYRERLRKIVEEVKKIKTDRE